MIEIGDNHGDLETCFTREEALERFGLIDRPSIPQFFACGIVDAGIGNCVVLEMPDGWQVLLAAQKLRDLQVYEPVGGGPQQLAHLDRLAVINAYPPGTNRDLVLADINQFQAITKQISREDMTLVRSGPNIWQNSSISFTALHANDDQKGHDGSCVAQPCDAVQLMGLVDSSGDEKWAPSYAVVAPQLKQAPWLQKLLPGDKEGHRPVRINGELRFIPIPMNKGQPLHGREVLAHIMANFAGLAQTKTGGGNWMDHEKTELTQAEQNALQARSLTARVVGNTLEYAKFYTTDLKWDKLATYRELIIRAWSIFSIFGGGEAKLEMGMAVLDLFSMPEGGKKRVMSKIVAHYARPTKFSNRMNRHLNMADPKKLIGARILNMQEADLCPLGILPSENDPFKAAEQDEFGPGVFRSAYGMIEHLYPTQTLFLQPDGVWIGTCTKSQTIYVGYTQPKTETPYELDISPLLSSAMEEGSVLKYTFDAATNNYTAPTRVPLAEVQAHLSEMAEDFCLMRADRPPPADIPRQVPPPPLPFVLPLPRLHNHRPGLHPHRIPVLNHWVKEPA